MCKKGALKNLTEGPDVGSGKKIGGGVGEERGKGRREKK